MKISKIRIQNFKSIKNEIIYPQNICALVGGNNSGKSNFIKALQLFFEPSTALVGKESFFQKDTSLTIEIKITFSKLTDWERSQFEPWMNNDVLTVGRRVIMDQGNIAFNTVAFIRIPEIEWLNSNIISGSKISEWWSEKDRLTHNGNSFLESLGTKKPTVKEWLDNIEVFKTRHVDEIDFVDSEEANPKGYANVLKGSLPEFIYVPAVRNVSDEMKVGKTNPFGQLINSIIEKLPDTAVGSLETQIITIEKNLNRSGGASRIQEITTVETSLNSLMSEIMDCDIEIEMSLPRLKEVVTAAKIYANDGLRTSIESKGHGLQRSLIFTILRAYSNFNNACKTEGEPEGRTTIFGIEEPELYLHPQAQRILMKVLRNISTTNDQVFYSTHSTAFVNVANFDEICIVSKNKQSIQHKSEFQQLLMDKLVIDLNKRKGRVGTPNGFREQYGNAFSLMINEGFFASKIIIVEGDSELYSLPIYSKLLDYDLDSNNVAVVHSHGKGQIDRLLRIFTGFNIPTYTWFDGDKNSKGKSNHEKTLELLNMLGDSTSKISEVTTTVGKYYAVIEDNYESLLFREINDYDKLLQEASSELGQCGKPLQHRYIANKIAREINVNGKNPKEIIPETIQKIVLSLKDLKHCIKVLKD